MTNTDSRNSSFIPSKPEQPSQTGNWILYISLFAVFILVLIVGVEVVIIFYKKRAIEKSKIIEEKQNPSDSIKYENGKFS